MPLHRLIHSGLAGMSLLALLAVESRALSVGDELERGLAAHTAGNFEQAARLLFPLAVNGDPEAQFKIGEMYETGDFFRRDACRSLVWYDKAARGGHATAMSYVALSYMQGEGVIQDPVRAHLWATAAAARGEYGSETVIQVMWLVMSDAQFATAQRLQLDFRPETAPPVDLYPVPQAFARDDAMLERLGRSGLSWCRNPW